MPVKLQIIPFRASHVPLINPGVNGEWRELAELAQKGEHGSTACILGEPVGCGGININQRAAQAEAWALFSPILKALPLSLFRAVKKGIDKAENALAKKGIKKLYAVIEKDDEKAKAFARHLGFEHKRDLYERDIKIP